MIASPPPGDSSEETSGARRPNTVPLPKHLSHLRLDDRGYPILATVPQTFVEPDFGMLSDRRKLAIGALDICGVCALPFTSDELRWQVTFAIAGAAPVEDRIQIPTHPAFRMDVFAEPPLHEICALYAAQVCPFVSSPYARHRKHTELRGQRRPNSVVLAGYRHTTLVAGADDAAGQGSVIFNMSGRPALHELTNRDTAYAAYQTAFGEEPEPTTDELDLRIAAHFVRDVTGDKEDPAASGLAGAAWIIGGAFAPGVDQVGTLEGLADPSLKWMKLAHQLLLDPDSAEDLKGSNFPEMDDVLDWFLEYSDDLPMTVQLWRKLGLETLTGPGGLSPRSGRRAGDPRKDKRRSAKASRRKNRR